MTTKHDCSLCQKGEKHLLTLTQCLNCTPFADKTEQFASEQSSSRIKCLQDIYNKFIKKVAHMVVLKDDLKCDSCYKGKPLFNVDIRPLNSTKSVRTLHLAVDLQNEDDLKVIEKSWLEFIKQSQTPEFSQFQNMFKKLNLKKKEEEKVK